MLEALKECETSLRFSPLIQEWFRRLIYHSRTFSQGETRASMEIHERDTDKTGVVERRRECDVGWGQSDSEMKCKKLWAANWLVHELYFCSNWNFRWKMLCLLIKYTNRTSFLQIGKKLFSTWKTILFFSCIKFFIHKNFVDTSGKIIKVVFL